MCLEAFMVAGKLEFLFFLLSLEYTVFCTDQALAQSYVVVYIQCSPFPSPFVTSKCKQHAPPETLMLA